MSGQLTWTTDRGTATVKFGEESAEVRFKRICFLPRHVLLTYETDGISRGYLAEDIPFIEFDKKE